MDEAQKEPTGERLGLGSFQKPPQAEGLSLDQLNRAFAAMLGGGDDPYTAPAEPTDDPIQSALAADPNESSLVAAGAHDARCEINPRSILEAMLFVGLPDGGPLTAVQIASLMRGVRPAEIDELVCDLNADYAATSRPYYVAAEGAGYRMTLQGAFQAVRDKFLGRVKEAKLSPAAIEVLAVVAYNEPLTTEQVNELRGTASGPILTQLVRRQLLRIERAGGAPPKAHYLTTERFLRLVGVESLAELPRGLDLELQ